MKHKTYGIAVLLAAVLLLSGCFGGTVKTGLLSRWDCGTPLAARFFSLSGDGQRHTLELDPSRLEDLTQTLDAMTYKTHGFHTDYFWGGQFGIELDLEDGRIWRYDGTRMELYAAAPGPEDRPVNSSFVEVTGEDFWETMKDFFPDLDKYRVFSSTW